MMSFFALHRPALLVIVLLVIFLHQGDFRDLLADLVPVLARCGHGKRPVQKPVRRGGHDEPSEEVDARRGKTRVRRTAVLSYDVNAGREPVSLVDVLGAHRNCPSDSTSKAHYVNKNAGDVCGVGTQVDASQVVVRSGPACAV